jgi:hypothetical protein
MFVFPLAVCERVRVGVSPPADLETPAEFYSLKAVICVLRSEEPPTTEPSV